MWMVMLDFICMGSAELSGTGRKWKNLNENMSPAGFEPTPGTPRQINQRFRPLGHIGKISSGVFIVLQYPDLWMQTDM